MLSDSGPLQFAVVVRFTLLKCVRLDLLAVEAMHFMILHATLLTGDLRDVLDKTNHGLRAVRIKLVIIAGLEAFKWLSALLLRRH